MKASIGGGDFELAPAGSVGARAFSIVDIGMQDSQYGLKHQIIITWELPSELMADGRPFVISQFFNLSLSEKANLCHCIEGIFGKKMPDEAKMGFDFQSLIDRPCLLNIVHKPKKDGSTKAEIAGYAPPAKGMTIPALQSEAVFFDLDEPDWALVDEMPEWISKRINGDAPTSKKNSPKDPADDFTGDDDIPF